MTSDLALEIQTPSPVVRKLYGIIGAKQRVGPALVHQRIGGKTLPAS